MDFGPALSLFRLDRAVGARCHWRFATARTSSLLTTTCALSLVPLASLALDTRKILLRLQQLFHLYLSRRSVVQPRLGSGISARLLIEGVVPRVAAQEGSEQSYQ